MKCQECGQRPATVHFTKIVQGDKSEFHLCEVCAREKGEWMSPASAGFSLNSLLSGLLNFDPPGGTAAAPPRCSTCGLTYSQFSQYGRFGCADCYKHFQSRLEPLLRKVHGSTTHAGKVPRRTGGKIKLQRELDKLRAQLQAAVQAERFEEAAELRDKIRAFEQQLGN
ncbi:UvrB/UvrC motif-containing protein [Effusibacillus pohliae]|uniref:UvrB/UvrC motif-containing protein n=1 Tax=Effusibacillus pohliae TaxID=232270 RepID=UPI000365FC51|nr:UvrB/UvrC motif-containing protein [Effusibacillus pohliae]